MKRLRTTASQGFGSCTKASFCYYHEYDKPDLNNSDNTDDLRFPSGPSKSMF